MSKKAEVTAVTTQDEIQARSLAIKQDAAKRQEELRELGVEASDLAIPLVQLMQGTSEMVGARKAVLGDIVNMQTEEKLGDLDKPIQILPLKLFKTLRTYDVTNNGFKFLHEEPLTAANEKTTTEGNENGTPVKRYHTLNFFVLLKSDLDKGEGFPCLVRFRSTGMHAGRALATHLYKRVHLRKLPYSQFVELACKTDKKGTATYAVFSIGKPENASPEAMQAAEQWLATLASVSYRIDEKEESDGEATIQAARPVVVDAEVVGQAAGNY